MADDERKEEIERNAKLVQDILTPASYRYMEKLREGQQSVFPKRLYIRIITKKHCYIFKNREPPGYQHYLTREFANIAEVYSGIFGLCLYRNVIFVEIITDPEVIEKDICRTNMPAIFEFVDE